MTRGLSILKDLIKNSVRAFNEICQVVTIIILPINYRLARKTIEEFSLKGEEVENEKY